MENRMKTTTNSFKKSAHGHCVNSIIKALNYDKRVKKALMEEYGVTNVKKLAKLLQ